MSDRSSDLIVHSTAPFNAEPSLERLRAHVITDTADFYVRSHGDVPEIDEVAYRLRLSGRVTTPLCLSMGELRDTFRECTVEAVMQCAGNRRSDLNDWRPTLGDPWAPGAIGNARWTGVRLAEVLGAAGVYADARHVAFTSFDTCEADGEAFFYGASIPMQKAMTGDVLLAYAMNGAPLTARHGFPLRVVVPGYAGVRSPKWLAAIEVRDTPSDCPIQAADYKLLPPDITSPDAIDWARGVTINALPINSAICEPAAGADLDPGPLTVRGYAMATDRPITRVDVSADGGDTWIQADLDKNVAPWSWTFWSAALALTPGPHTLVVRAWDAAGQTQPAAHGDVWNVKGYLSAAWHRIDISVRP